MPLELRKSFQLIIGALSLALCVACWLAVRNVFSTCEANAQVALGLLLVVSPAGFYRLFMAIVPLVLVKAFPSLESSNG